MRAFDTAMNDLTQTSVLHKSHIINSIDQSQGPALLRIASQAIGKDISLVGMWNERPTVMTVRSIDANILHATIKKTNEDVFIALEYVILILRTTTDSRTSWLSRSRGCEFIFRLACPPTLMMA
jgi:hypothetical protein